MSVKKIQEMIAKNQNANVWASESDMGYMMPPKAKRRTKPSHQHFIEPTPERWQHGDVIQMVATDLPGVRAPRVETQTNLDRYLKHRRITQRQYDAGSRIYADWRRQGGEPRVVAAYEHRIPGGQDADREIRARERYREAMQSVGKRLSGVIVHVALLDHSVGDWARGHGYRAEAGMAALHLALDTLADHYRLTPSDG